MRYIFNLKKVCIVLVQFILISVTLTGCVFFSDKEEEEENSFTVMYLQDSVKIGNHIVVYHPYKSCIYYGEVEDNTTKIIKEIPVPYQMASVTQIVASEKYIYIVLELSYKHDGDNRDVLRYDLGMNYIDSQHFPFQKLFYRDGYLFGYKDKRTEQNNANLFLTPDYIEATHYIKEQRWKEQWDIINKKEKKVKIGSITLFKHKYDLLHPDSYFSTNKPIDLFTGREFCSSGKYNGYTADIDTFSQKYEKKIIAELGLEGENFDMELLQGGNNIYGFCNVFKEDWDYAVSRSDGLEDLKYSFTFCYSYYDKKFTIIQKYLDGELLGYVNSKQVIYRKGNSVYTQALLNSNDKQEWFTCSQQAEVFVWDDIQKGSELYPIESEKEKYFDLSDEDANFVIRVSG